MHDSWLSYLGRTKSTAALLTVYFASADDLLWLASAWGQLLRGKPNKKEWPPQFAFTAKRARNFNKIKTAVLLSLLLCCLRTTTMIAAELLPYIPYITQLYGFNDKRIHSIGLQNSGIITQETTSIIGSWISDPFKLQTVCQQIDYVTFASLPCLETVI